MHLECVKLVKFFNFLKKCLGWSVVEELTIPQIVSNFILKERLGSIKVEWNKLDLHWFHSFCKTNIEFLRREVFSLCMSCLKIRPLKTCFSGGVHCAAVFASLFFYDCNNVFHILRKENTWEVLLKNTFRTETEPDRGTFSQCNFSMISSKATLKFCAQMVAVIGNDRFHQFCRNETRWKWNANSIWLAFVFFSLAEIAKC